MKILILTAKFGMGHWSASRSLEQQLRRVLPGARTRVVDLIACAFPAHTQAVYRSFELLVTRGKGLYNAFYRLFENESVATPSLLALGMTEPLVRLLRAEAPDAVICTHPLCAQAMSRCKEEGETDIPLITCVTDVTCHSEWLTAGCDAYLVPAPDVRDAFLAKGVDPRRILVTGIPVRSEFKLPPRRSDSVERRLLIMGGGLGLLPDQDWFYDALDRFPHIRVTLITGKNAQLYTRLHGKYRHIEVLGCTDRVYEYMAAAHLMLSKPGGITLFEAIFSQLPILAWEPFLEQERRNADFLLRTGIGAVAPLDPAVCLERLEELLYDRAALEAMEANMALLQDDLCDQSLERLLALLTPGKEAAA